MRLNIKLRLAFTINCVLALFINDMGLTQNNENKSSIRVGMVFNPNKINFGLDSLNEEISDRIAYHIFDNVLQIDSDGNIAPSLATSWEFINNKSLLLHLKQNVYFHNNELFDSESVKFSLYEIKKNVASWSGNFLQNISDVEIINQYKVVIKTYHPDGLLLNKLAVFGRIFPKKYIEKNSWEYFKKNPIGTGPFKFYNKNVTTITLIKNNTYWNKAFPTIDIITWQSIDKPSDVVNLLLKYKLDIIADIDGTNTLQIKKHRRLQILKKKALYVVFGQFYLKNTNSIINNIKIRQAINHAINRDDLFRLVLKGNGIIISTFSMEDEFGHNKKLTPYKYDIDLAKKLLKETGYKNGLELKVGFQEGFNENFYFYKFLKNNLKSVNINLIPYKNFSISENIIKPNKNSNIKKWNGDIIIGGDPDLFNNSLFLLCDTFMNFSPYSTVDDKILQHKINNALDEIDSVKQGNILENIDAYIYKNYYLIPGFQKVMIYGIKRNIDFKPHIGRLLDLRFVNVLNANQ